jgi:MFS family permease
MSMSVNLDVVAVPVHARIREDVKVVVGASVGTVLEWFDFFLYGSLAIFFSAHFFPSGNSTSAMLASLATFGVGFVVRPIGAVLFGRFGDKAGRKATFLATVILMGVSTAGIGLLPSFQTIGWASPCLLVLLRLLQGLALGGEYGGAAVYIAEHSRPGRRGFNTSFLQTTAPIGFLLSLAVTLATKAFILPQEFSAWGWRVPFISSLLLLAVSTYIRTTLHESPVFARMKRENRLSASPLRDTMSWGNVKSMFVVLMGAQAGVAVVWYTCNFYVMYFMTTTLKVPTLEAYGIIAVMLLASLPMYVFFGWLSDRIGRKWLVLIGCALAVATIQPVFHELSRAVNPKLVEFQERTTIRLHAANCVGGLFSTPDTDCDKAREFLTQAGVSFAVEPPIGDAELVSRIGTQEVTGFSPTSFRKALEQAGYPAAADMSKINHPLMYGLLMFLMICASMAYGPLSAYYVELFPAKVRYTSVSVPYNIGAGYFGGLAPFISTALAVNAGNIYQGLWYTIVVGIISVVIGAFCMRETRGLDFSE